MAVFNSFPPDICHARYNKMNGYQSFIKWEHLDSSVYVKNDELVIDCNIQVLKPDFQILSLPNQEVNILVKVDDQTFRVNKSLLFANSTVLKSRISHAIRNHMDIVIGDVEPEIFKAILWFLYTGTLFEEEQETLIDSGEDLTKSWMGKLLAAANLYKLKSLKACAN